MSVTKLTMAKIPLILALLTLCCQWPYSPEPEPYPNTPLIPTATDAGTLYTVNTGRQICNPSISQDMAHYPACMLWLGFSGSLVVTVPPAMSGYLPIDNVKQHDRLTISDTANVVRWYVLRSEMSIAGHLQDPEWTTHPDYITFLGQDDAGNWDGYVVRISDKAYLKICDNVFGETSTPHIWLPDSIVSTGVVTAPAYDTLTGFAAPATITEFFGTRNVKVAYALKTTILTINYIDYSDSIVRPTALNKPENKKNWNCESPLISPDGNWIAYNCFESIASSYDSYIQRLHAGSRPVLIAEKAFEPHWWVDPVDPAHSCYIIYSQLPGSIVVSGDLTDPATEKNGTAGTTVKQRLRGTIADGPEHMGLQVDGSAAPVTLSRLPFKGGLSKDGRFLCTGYINAYLFRLP